MANEDASIPSGGQILIYRDGATQLQVRLDGQSVWITQAQMAELFQTTPRNITIHIKSIYDDGGQDEAATCKEYLQVRSEGARQVQRAASKKEDRRESLDFLGLVVDTSFSIPAGRAVRQLTSAGFSFSGPGARL